MDKNPVMIAYWGDKRDVLWCEAGMGDEFTRISDRFTSFITKGHITEVLEYWLDDGDEVGSRCDYWREQLRELGYDLRR